MPFTLSHAVLAPPLAKLTGDRLPIAALAIGMMVPDLYRLFTEEQSNLTHLWGSIIHPNLWIGLIFSALWYYLYRPVIYRFLGIQHNLPIFNILTGLRFILYVNFGLILGISTHLIWDGLTHADFRTFAFKAFLEKPVHIFDHIYPIHRILQIGTSLATLPLLIFMVWRYYVRFQQHSKINKKVKNFGLGLILFSLFVGTFAVWNYAYYFSHQIWQSDLYYFIGRAFNEFSQAALLFFSFGCILFLILDKNK